ncbi:M23 family metallopeptidase [Winogradskyella endarachnes]|uniref:Peptidoglycan DD-metalloendopeptidase family protein n=1 Tax=Winogradskyella endarachnes TaxID=2681965 RepID=A0A6L6U490_9FLAO|nr:M23 family metallopeptidase [Winogradskyella endarachnes]MUU76865.1 peptidoglycan DD-metalloendopeptidase family protein [Winogradskyella endarachnes]
MIKYQIIYCLFYILLISCNNKTSNTPNSYIDVNVSEELNDLTSEIDLQKDYKSLIEKDSSFISNGFDFPVGKPNGSGYYNAQKFQENNHLGDDWNGVGGGNSDLGDPIYAIANGYISEAKDYKGGWGNVVRIVHLHNNKLYESLYAHCDSILVKSDRLIKKGEQIATIGNCNGTYFAHLHFEIRNDVDLDIGGGYSKDTTGYLNPTEFINKNRN